MHKIKKIIKNFQVSIFSFWIRFRNLVSPFKGKVEVEITRYDNLGDIQKRQIDIVFFKGFRKSFQDHLKKWGRPHDIVNLYLDRKLIGFSYVVFGEVLMDGHSVRIGGLAGLTILPQYRGLGLGGILVDYSTNHMFKSKLIKECLLICADELVFFYKKYGWRKIDADLFFIEKGVKKRHKGTKMLISKRDKFSVKKICVDGKLW